MCENNTILTRLRALFWFLVDEEGFELKLKEQKLFC